MSAAHSVFRHAPAFVREALPHFNLLHYRLFSAVESVAGNFLGPVAAHHAAAVGSSLAMAAALLLPFFLLALALVDLWAPWASARRVATRGAVRGRWRGWRAAAMSGCEAEGVGCLDGGEGGERRPEVFVLMRVLGEKLYGCPT